MAVFRYWPTMMRDIEEEQYDAKVSYYHNNGEKIYGMSPN